jgi:predicted RNase H-like HicB family nuclease
MKSLHYPVLVEQDVDGVFIVECPVFDGCRSYGDTLDEAMVNIREVIALCRDEQADSDFGTTFLGVRDVEMVI